MRARDPYDAELVRRVAARAPVGFAVFLLCLALSTLFEVLHFPERRAWMLGFAGGFVLLVAVCWTLVRRRPTWSIPLLVVFVNVVGIAINAYHAVVGASVAMCVWSLTGLLASAVLILPWGPRNQTVACLGALLSFPIHLELGVTDGLTWAAGGTYLLVAAVMSAFGASLYESYLRADLRLSSALSEREARLQSYFDLSAVGTAILAPDGACREVNDELCRILGYSRTELLGKRWSEIVHPEERAAIAEKFGQTLAGTGAVLRRDGRCIGRDGASIDVFVSMRGLPGPTGLVDHVMVLVHDITERKRAESEREQYLASVQVAREQAESASRAKDAFLATVSHELRTPLSPILAWARLLRDRTLDAEKTARALAAIERNARAQVRLIDDLLDVSRVVSGEWRLERRPVDLAPVVRAAAEVVRPAAEAKGVHIETEVDPVGALVSGDAHRLQQVVWNLLANAVKFTPHGGRVRVTMARTAARVRMTVRDTGEGISPTFLPHVFEQFRQADSSSTRRHGGLGLGLAIVRELVALHGGTVRAESAGEGRGSVFTVELPLAPSGEVMVRAERVVAVEAEAAARAALDGLQVLVVDDDPDSNEAVSTLLSSCGVEVRTATSAPQALEVLGQWRPDVLVSDIAMPGTDGYALIASLRARTGPLRDLPAIALTAYAGVEDRNRVLAAGFQAHVTKPVNVGDLLRAVGNAARPGAPSAA